MRTITIKASDYIENGFSEDDADKIAPLIKNAVNNGENVKLDFKGIRYYTTLFFSKSLTYLIKHLGKDEYNKRVTIVSLTASGRETYKLALAYAIEFYQKT